MTLVPVFGNEGFDAINFPLLISLLLRAQGLLGVGLHVTLRDQHFVRHGQLETRDTKQTLHTSNK